MHSGSTNPQVKKSIRNPPIHKLKKYILEYPHPDYKNFTYGLVIPYFLLAHANCLVCNTVVESDFWESLNPIITQSS